MQKKVTNGETIPDNGTNSGDTTTIPEGKFPYAEGIYYGTGEGYLGDITCSRHSGLKRSKRFL